MARLDTLLPVSCTLHMNKSFAILPCYCGFELGLDLLFRYILHARSILGSPSLDDGEVRMRDDEVVI